MRNAAQNLLELAAGYAEAGLYQDAEAPLATLCRDQDAAHTYPMVNYLRAHFRLVQGDAAGAADLLAKAAAGPVVYVNPHRIEEKSALESALSRNPNDAHAHLFLGNLLYAWGLRPEGLEHWRAAVRLDPALALAWRNVAYAEQHFEKKPQTAYASYRRAFELDPTDARVLLEMIQLAERLRMPAAARLALLEAHPETVSSRDDLSAALVDLRIAQGSPDSLGKAHEVLSARHFHTWEGRYGIHLSWVEVNQKLGDLAFGRKDFTTALDYYRQALEYPKNLEVAPRTPDFRAHLNWDLAKAYLALGRREEAKRGLEEILAEKYEKPHLGTFYQALAQKELNRRAEYDTLLAKLEKRSRDLSSGKFEYRGDLDAIGRYLLSLVLGERGDQAAAELERKAALARAPQVRRLAIRQAQLDVAAAHQ
jgi:tetratricopeptide (TPR) repeat protein